MMTQTFEEFWYDYRIKNGLRRAPLQREAARMGWHAAARQNVPDQLAEACREAYDHTTELRDAWSRGVLEERDGQRGRRSNHNVDVNVKLRLALESLAP
jgi:hypothetical protein